MKNLYRINNDGQVEVIKVLADTKVKIGKKNVLFHITDKMSGNTAICIPADEVGKTIFSSVPQAKAHILKLIDDTVKYYEKARKRIERVKES